MFPRLRQFLARLNEWALIVWSCIGRRDVLLLTLGLSGIFLILCAGLLFILGLALGVWPIWEWWVR